MFNKPAKIITLTTLWAVIVTGLTLTDFPQTGTTNTAEAAVYNNDIISTNNLPNSVDVSKCSNRVRADWSIKTSVDQIGTNSWFTSKEAPSVKWTLEVSLSGRNGATINGQSKRTFDRNITYYMSYPDVSFKLESPSNLGNNPYRFRATSNSNVTGRLNNVKVDGSGDIGIGNMLFTNGKNSTYSNISVDDNANFYTANWLGNTTGLTGDTNRRLGWNRDPSAQSFSHRVSRDAFSPYFKGDFSVSYSYPTSGYTSWSVWSSTGNTSSSSKPSTFSDTKQTRWRLISLPYGYGASYWSEEQRTRTPTTVTTSGSCTVSYEVNYGHARVNNVTGQKIVDTPKFDNTIVTIGRKNTNETLSGAIQNQSISHSQIGAPYAGNYRDRMCRIEGDVSALPGSEPKSQTLTHTFLQNSGGAFWTAVNKIAEYPIDRQKTWAANSWAHGYPEPYFQGKKTIQGYSPFTGYTPVTYTSTAFDYDFVTVGPFAYRLYPAAGKTLTVFYYAYDKDFEKCFEALTNENPSKYGNRIRVSRKLDLTGNHPAKISYVVAGYNETGPRADVVSAVQCLPEATGLSGLTIYDPAQGEIYEWNYQGLDNGSNYRLNRSEIRFGTLGANRQLPLGGRVETTTDRWTTALAPAFRMNSIAGGARNPSESSIACVYPKQNSATFLEWSRTNPYLPISRGPVYVDDTINVSSAYAQKVSDPGRIITGNVTVRLTGPGYSQSRSCSNPCNPFSFPPVPNAGTYTLSASWGGDSGLNGSSTSTSFTVLKYDTRLSFDRIQRTLNGETITDFTSTRPVPVNNLHLQNTSIPWVPTVPPGDMGSGTIRVEVQQKRFGQSNWSNFTDFRLANPNCLMSANPCPEFGIRFEREAEYRVRITYQGNRKYNASVAPSANGWSNPFWVYEDFKCFIPQNADGDSIRVYHLENNRAVSKFRGNILRDGNNIVAEYPVLIDGRHFTGIVRLGGLRTNTMFEGTPRADGELVRVFQIPVLSNSEMLNLLQGRYDNSFTEARILPNQPQQGLYRFNNVENYFSFPVNTNPDGTARKNAFRVFEVSDVGGSLKIMQEITIFDSIFYQNGTRRSGSISCEPEDSPQSGPLVMRKATVID